MKWYVADTETTTKKVNAEKSWVWLWGIKGCESTDELVWDLSLVSFLEFVKENKCRVIFFHNLSFDGNYVFKWLLNNGYYFVDTMDNDNEIGRNEWGWLCNEQGNIYAMEINYEGHRFKLLDSYKVLMSSVGDLGESINLNKLKMDYDTYYTTRNEVPKKVINYLERDIDVVLETFKKAISVVDRKMTRASMAYNHFMEYYGKVQFAKDFGGKLFNFTTKKFEWKNVLTQEQWEMVHKSYNGGYVNFRKDIVNKKLSGLDGHYVDVNSLFPSVMESNRFPYGKMWDYPPPNSTYCELWVIHIKYAKKKNPRAPSLFKEKKKSIDAKYLSELKNDERIMWKQEFEFILQHYDIDYKIYAKKYFKTKFIFNKWIGEMKKYKIEADEKVTRDFWKGIQNSLYGKFGQKMIIGSRIIVPNKSKKKSVARYGKNGEFTHKTKFTLIEELKYIPIASYTTMLGRLELFNAIFDNLSYWLYSDTDSCSFTKKPVGIRIHPSDYGAWDEEYRFTSFKVLRAKCYMMFATHKSKNGVLEPYNKVVKKISGLSDEGKEKVNWDNFHLGGIIIDGKQSSKNVIGGKHIIDSDFKFVDKIVEITKKQARHEKKVIKRYERELAKEMEALNV